MERRVINPWKWQDQYGFVQANLVSGGARMLVCSGQTSTDAEGKTVHAGDMRGQILYALENVETVVRAAGMKMSDVQSLRYYTTDVDEFLKHMGVAVERLEKAGCKCASTLLGVTRLAFADLLVEIEALAVT